MRGATDQQGSAIATTTSAAAREPAEFGSVRRSGRKSWHGHAGRLGYADRWTLGSRGGRSHAAGVTSGPRLEPLSHRNAWPCFQPFQSAVSASTSTPCPRCARQLRTAQRLGGVSDRSRHEVARRDPRRRRRIPSRPLRRHSRPVRLKRARARRRATDHRPFHSRDRPLAPTRLMGTRRRPRSLYESRTGHGHRTTRRSLRPRSPAPVTPSRRCVAQDWGRMRARVIGIPTDVRCERIARRLRGTRHRR